MTAPEQGSLFPGDPFGLVKPDRKNDGVPSSGEVLLAHRNADTDSSKNAIHHTLGVLPNQAAMGNHVHDGGTGRRLFEGRGITLTGSKGGNAALANLITLLASEFGFTDGTT